MNNLEPKRRRTTLLTIIGTVVLALLIVSSHVPSAQAQTQPWTAPDASNNISNTNTGNVGVGTTTPGVKLDVVKAGDGLVGRFGGANATDNPLFEVGNPAGFVRLFAAGNAGAYMGGTAQGDSGMMIAPNRTFHFGVQNSFPFFTVAPSGNIGIGTTTPQAKLDVAGGISSTGNITQTAGANLAQFTLQSDGNSAHYSILQFNKQTRTTSNPTDIVEWSVAYTHAASGIGGERNLVFVGGRKDGGYTEPLIFQESGNVIMAGGGQYGTLMGNVGIGTTAPAYKLDVAGPVNATGFYVNGSPLQVGGGGGSQWTTNGTSVYYNNGNAGIGTTTPAYKFTVSGTGAYNGAGSAQIAVNNTTATTGRTWNLHSGDDGSFQIFRSDDSLTKLYFPAGNATSAAFLNGNVGIGTTTPAAKLAVAGTITQGNGAYWTLDTSVVPNDWTMIGSTDATTQRWLHFGYRLGDVVGGAYTDSAKINFYNGAAVFGINGGNVGIGTAAPSAKLDVAGNVNASGNLNATGTITGGNIVAKYQDVAEWVPAIHALPAGTVVVLNPDKSNQVRASFTTYDTRVAGVVSTQPGIALGESGVNKVLVATTGRVKVKVDASRSPIRVGDLLVTSDTEGLAMKSEPVMISGRPFHSPGTLIGKALEPLASGAGEILVLLSLQ